MHGCLDWHGIGSLVKAPEFQGNFLLLWPAELADISELILHREAAKRRQERHHEISPIVQKEMKNLDNQEEEEESRAKKRRQRFRLVCN